MPPNIVKLPPLSNFKNIVPPQKEILLPNLPSPQLLATTALLSVSVDFLILNISYKRYHTLHNLLYLV